jgi:hypothetical protein
VIFMEENIINPQEFFNHLLSNWRNCIVKVVDVSFSLLELGVADVDNLI